MNFQDVFIAEGDLRQVPTEDGYAYYPDLSVIAMVDNQYYAHPHFFLGSYTALWEAEDLVQRINEKGVLDPDIWVKIEDQEYRYSNGNNEYYDTEEEYYMNSRG